MGTGGHILVLLEDGECHEESVRYAFELAKRLSGRVDVLILFAGMDERDCGCDELRGSLAQVAVREGIQLTTFVRSGDKASELIKHIATHRPIDMMVWGGDGAAFGRARRHKHWLARIRSEIECPVVTATKKSTTT